MPAHTEAMPGTTAERRDLAALRAAVYRPGATPDDVAALERALGQLREGEPPARAPTPPPSTAAGRGVLAPSAEGGDLRAEEGRGRFTRFAGPWWVAAAVTVTTVAGCAAGAALVLLARPGGASAAAVVPTTVHLSTTAGEAVFRRAQRASDRPVTALDPDLVPGSVRRLLGAGRIELYAALDRQGRRCLVGVQGGAVRSCVTPDRFRRSGLRILWASDVRTVDPAGLREVRYRLSLAADWRPDGRVILGAVAG